MTEEPRVPTSVGEDGCICSRNYTMCEDGHAIDCPASNQHESWKAMSAKRYSVTPTVTEGETSEDRKLAGYLVETLSEHLKNREIGRVEAVLFVNRQTILKALTSYAAGLPSSTPVLDERERLREAVERLERANDEVAKRTTRERYLTDLGDVQPALLELDDARAFARSALASIRSSDAG